MSSPAEIAARTYLALFAERDPAERARMLEACWAEDGRLVTSGDGLRGRAAIEAMVQRVQADPRDVRIRMTSPIDVQGRMFRFHGALEAADGTLTGEAFDAGEVDADGRITTLMTFKGVLR
jgi:hypothetical protein